MRAEAANALGQAAQALKNRPSERGASPIDSVFASLAARLKVDDEPDVRAAIDETLGRLPYTTAAEASRTEASLLETLARNPDSLPDRLGVAKGFEAFARITTKFRPLGPDAVAALRAPGRARPCRRPTSARGERVRRLALEALISADAVDDGTLARVSADEDAQVRRIAMRAAAAGHSHGRRRRAEPGARRRLADGAVGGAPRAGARATPRRRARRRSPRWRMPTRTSRSLALDQLAACGSSPDAVAALDRAVTDLSDAGSPRGWHRAAHAHRRPRGRRSRARDAAALGQFTGSSIWQLRMYAARAAAHPRRIGRRSSGWRRDDDDNVCEAAVEALSKLAGHEADRLYLPALARQRQPGDSRGSAGARRTRRRPTR